MSEQLIAGSFPVLEQMVEKANAQNVKLTLMFTAQWADYIAKSPERMQKLEEWKANGNEIAAHHHGLTHGTWDGYTDYNQEFALQKREEVGKLVAETYLGTLEEYISKLQKINPTIHSGCLNDEADKNDLPNEIIYDTCSGFANYGIVGTIEEDSLNPEKAKNEYASTGVVKGIERVWLTHFQINVPAREKKGEQMFSSMNSSQVFGGVVHSSSPEARALYSFLDFLKTRDANGEKSRTVSEIIEEGILPEKAIPSEKLFLPAGASAKSQGKCGDGVCGPLEQADSYLCPQDCK
ncbi:MAG: hypothetical protein V1847_05290 [Candidatus Diapherotrites archaeon]